MLEFANNSRIQILARGLVDEAVIVSLEYAIPRWTATNLDRYLFEGVAIYSCFVRLTVNSAIGFRIVGTPLASDWSSGHRVYVMLSG
ncbi:MAG: hypothetical protein ABSE82_14495 [Nitrososphaerales archaeon]